MGTYEVRLTVEARSGWRCECCGGSLAGPFGYSLHHRRPRGMGGSKAADTNQPSNFLAVCGSGTTGCHGFIERHRAWAYDNGWLVRRGHSPALTPIHGYPGRRGPVWLDDEGRVNDSPPEGATNAES